MTLEEVKALFIVAQVEATNFIQLPNGYHSSDTAPWWLVKTEHGYIRIGVRKRVVDIDWETTGFKWTGDLFPKDDVTKDETHIHAWSMSKAAEYLNLLQSSIRNHAIHNVSVLHTRQIKLPVEAPGYILNRVLGSKEFDQLVRDAIQKEQGSKAPTTSPAFMRDI